MTQQGKPHRDGAVRRGTATRRAGRETAARLVEAAHALLQSEPYHRFTLRAVADRAGVSLANLQYYFPRREDLARALYIDVGERYRAAHERLLRDAPADPEARFRRVLHFNMQDIQQRETRQFFIQFWALLGALDDFRGGYLGQLYAMDIAQLRDHLLAWRVDLPMAEATRRVTLIAAMIEGLMVVAGDQTAATESSASLIGGAFEAAMAIARGS